MAADISNSDIAIKYIGIGKDRLVFTVTNLTNHSFTYQKYTPAGSIDSAYFEVLRGSWKQFGRLFFCGTMTEEESKSFAASFTKHELKPKEELLTSIGLGDSQLTKGDIVKITIEFRNDVGPPAVFSSPEIKIK